MRKFLSIAITTLLTVSAFVCLVLTVPADGLGPGP